MQMSFEGIDERPTYMLKDCSEVKLGQIRLRWVEGREVFSVDGTPTTITLDMLSRKSQRLSRPLGKRDQCSSNMNDGRAIWP